MKNRKYFFSILLILISILFSENSTILWDFGVIIEGEKNKHSKGTTPLENSNLITKYTATTKAHFSDSFIAPKQISFLDNQINKKKSTISLDKNIFHTFDKIKLFIGKLTFQKNYTFIIDILEQNDFSYFNDYDVEKLNYWLAEAYYNIGKHKKTEEILKKISIESIDEHAYFLQALNYEKVYELDKAIEAYINFMKKFPNSDYKTSALIKIRMLSRMQQ